MPSDTHDAWKILFDKALTVLDSAGISVNEWTFGGGTALMIWFRHRVSRDIDIFLTNAQHLSFLTPRLNDTAQSMTDDYTEGSNFLKLKFPEGEIDFIIAPHLTNTPYEEREGQI